MQFSLKSMFIVTFVVALLCGLTRTVYLLSTDPDRTIPVVGIGIAECLMLWPAIVLLIRWIGKHYK